MAYTILRRKWPLTKLVWMSMPFELAGLVPILVLFGLSQPDAWRTKMWQIGYNYGFNSNPLMTLYAMANYKPLPTVPFVWNQMQTNFNVAISVLTLFILLAKMIAYIMHVWWPIIALAVNLVMTVLWTVSVYGQMGPDYADPRYPSPIAWYIRKSCSLAAPYGAASQCALAKASFGVSVYLLALYVFGLGVSIWAMWPREDAEDLDDEDEDEEKAGGNTDWEMHSMKSPGIPPTPGRAVPFTPRTMAFHTLDRKLPLRYE